MRHGHSHHDALKRARTHLNLLEQDPTHPLDLLVDGAERAPVLILRAEEKLRSAHSGAVIGHAELRGLFISALKRTIEELEADGAHAEGRDLKELQYGDQTEA
ncbi:hypothetical protein [Ancylobacter terrae]|uniref:hypothetical protein n=1 Tax=Ancylobacter sp. sgz301288 TaxID=3342077 RepID=UPI00385E47E1